MQQPSGQDASFVYLETPSTPMHIGSAGIYDPSTAPGGFVRFKDILGLINTIYSYVDEIAISFTGDRDMMPDPAAYAAALKAAFDELLAAA